MPEILEKSIYDTVRWWGLFERPVTATEIWRSLVVDSDSDQRWRGQKVFYLKEIQDVLENSEFLNKRLGSKWGYYYLAESSPVDEYLRRHRLAQMKWKLTRNVAKYLQYVPFVRGIFGSGSLSVMNTRESSDLDLFIVAKGGRLWTARLFLLLVAQLTGRRRRYWQGQAPDRVCLNHYVADSHMLLPADIHNLYTAMLYTHLVPLTGGEVVREFADDNYWIRRLVMAPVVPYLTSIFAVKEWRWLMVIRNYFEDWLSEPIGDLFENWAEKVQRRVIQKHSKPMQSGRVSLSDYELAFHPDSKVEGLLVAYAQDPGQGQLL